MRVKNREQKVQIEEAMSFNSSSSLSAETVRGKQSI